MTDTKTQNEILKDRLGTINTFFDALVLEHPSIQSNEELEKDANAVTWAIYNLFKKVEKQLL